MHVISELSEQLHEFIEAPMNIADDVERPVLVAEVRPERLPLDLHRLHLLRRVEHIDVAKTFALKATNGPAHLLMLLPHDMSAEIAVRPAAIPLAAQLLRQPKDDSDRHCVIFTGDRNQRLPRLLLNVRRIDYCKAAQSKPLSDDEVQDVECVLGRRLVIFIVADQPAAEVRRDHFRLKEVLGRKRRFSAA